MNLFKKIFSGKRVLITGHTGFKGSWLTRWLTDLGANITGLSLGIPTTPSNFDASSIGDLIDDTRGDITDLNLVKKLLDKQKPDFIFHLAAQALVRTSYDDPITTLQTNAIGTANILEALRHVEHKAVAIMITSDKAYDNVEWLWGYRETDRLGGKDPYSASKAMAEMAIRTYYESFFKSKKSNVRIGIARAGNVIGGGDWAKDRIVSDCMRAWSKKEMVKIRSPEATRPWQHVLEPLSGYLTLACALSETNHLHGEAFNFGPSSNYNKSVRDLIDTMGNYWENIKWDDVSKSGDHPYEAGLLKLNCDKSLAALNWEPTLDFETTIRMTVEWYKSFYQEEGMFMGEYTSSQIREYMHLAEKKKLKWALRK